MAIEHNCTNRSASVVCRFVVAENLLIEVPEQVVRLNVNVRAMQSTLQERPEVVHRVRMNVAVHVFDRVVNHGVAGSQTLIPRTISIHR